MSIIINATSNSSYLAYNDMLKMLRPQKNAEQEVKLSAKQNNEKPAELSKKEVQKEVVALAPEEVESLALSPASEPVDDATNEAEEILEEELVEDETSNELKIVVKSDELTVANNSNSILGSITTDDEMDYNGDGEVTLDEKLRYLREQNETSSLPDVTLAEASNKTPDETAQTGEIKTIEIPEQKAIEVPKQKTFETQTQNSIKTQTQNSIEAPKQNNMFNQAQLTGTQKFNYNNLQKAYMAQPQAQQSLITRVA